MENTNAQSEVREIGLIESLIALVEAISTQYVPSDAESETERELR